MSAKVERRALTEDEITAIRCLSGVRFLPASWEKRFNRDTLQPELTRVVPALSEKAIAQLWRLFIRYRRQWALSPRETDRLLNYACDHSAADFRKQQAAARAQRRIDELKEKYGQRLQSH